MIRPAKHPREFKRLEAVQSFSSFENNNQGLLEDVVFLVAELCQTPLACIACVEEKTIRVLARKGRVSDFNREFSFCAHTILQNQVFEVYDATKDIRFSDIPESLSLNNIRFYAGIPILDPVSRLPILTLSVFDTTPRYLSDSQKKGLALLAKQIERALANKGSSVAPVTQELVKEQQVTHEFVGTHRQNLRSRISLDLLLSTIGKGILLQNKSGELIECNTAAENILQLKRSQIAGEQPRDPRWRVMREDGTDFGPLDVPSKIVLRTGQDQLNVIVRILTPEGNLRWLMTNYHAIEIGKETHCLTTISDITNLKEKQFKNEQVVMALHQSAIVTKTDAYGKITEVNEKFLKISGYSREETIGKDHRIINSGVHSRQFFKDLWKTISSGEVWTGDITNRAKDGSFYHVHSVLSPLWGLDGRIREYIAIRFDMTAEVQSRKDLAEIQAQSAHNSKLAALGEIAGGVAHEINNPLAVMLGNLDLLIRRLELDDAGKDRITKIRTAGERIHRIVEGLKRFARSGPQLEFAPSKVSDIFNAVSVTAEIKAKAINTNLSFNYEVDQEIICDSSELEMVLFSLVSNAIDAVAEQDNRWVRVESMIKGDHLVLRVIDSGPGVPSDVEGRLFLPFVTTKEIGQGPGLGLSIARGIVEMHGGRIFLNKQFPNTCFEIVLPLRGQNQVAA